MSSGGRNSWPLRKFTSSVADADAARQQEKRRAAWPRCGHPELLNEPLLGAASVSPAPRALAAACLRAAARVGERRRRAGPQVDDRDGSGEKKGGIVKGASILSLCLPDMPVIQCPLLHLCCACLSGQTLGTGISGLGGATQRGR